ncbi:MAG TPA: tRNA (adenosine(37)-N6)-threonylcarbamoyltransferase complex ATPase subunit type 1 TsaE [Burkholderiaceae bacterium]|nr:tRNA (adenosine(37)-N6)-threonylcarbamoyltransferase complex ATPase subunit type 1 TsaE [Burkholderiaceae bacterium]
MVPAPPALARTELTLPDEAATARLGARLAAFVQNGRATIERAGFTLALSGDLGAGKTSLVRAMLRALGETGPVKSPTYTLLEPYVVSSLDFHHFDFYRVKDPSEFDAAGFRELFGPRRVCVIEWPERAGGRLPTPDLSIALRVEGLEDQQDRAQAQLAARVATMVAHTELGARCLQTIQPQQREL